MITNASLAAMSKKWRYRLPLTFFGLNDEVIRNVYEQLFLLKYHGGWSFFESYNLPVRIRVWFLERLIEEREKEAEQIKSASRTKPQGRGRRYT